MKGNRLANSIPIEVKFRIEMRPSTSAQVEAGRRLFKKLVARAQSIIGEASSEETSSWKK